MYVRGLNNRSSLCHNEEKIVVEIGNWKCLLLAGMYGDLNSQLSLSTTILQNSFSHSFHRKRLKIKMKNHCHDVATIQGNAAVLDERA
jgi:hypothetical protein